MYEHPAAGHSVAVHHARLHVDEIQRIAAARAHDRKVLHRLLGHQIAVVAGSAGLHHLGRRLHLHLVGDGAHFELDVYRSRLPDADQVAGRVEGAKARGLHIQFVGTGLHGFEDVRAGGRRLGVEGHARSFVDQFDGDARHDGPSGILYRAENAGSGALRESRSAGTQTHQCQNPFSSHIGKEYQKRGSCVKAL